MELDELMTKDSSLYRFHGVKECNLSRILKNSEEGVVTLWGRADEDADEEEDEVNGYLPGRGELSVTRWNDIEMSCNEFCDEDGVVFVLEPVVESPREDEHPSDRREFRIQVEEWRVIGGIRPVFQREYDEDDNLIDEEIVEFQALSLQDILEL